MLNRLFVQSIFILLCFFVARPASAAIITATDFGELLDLGPDGVPDEIFPGATAVALSNIHEARSFFEFDLATAPANVTQAILTLGPIDTTFSGCGDLFPCPLMTDLLLFSYAADGTVEFSDYPLGGFAAVVSPLPADGSLLMLDVTLSVLPHLAANDPFIGFSARAGSLGAASLGFSSNGIHRLRLLPEPSTGFLLGIGLFVLAARRWRGNRT